MQGSSFEKNPGDKRLVSCVKPKATQMGTEPPAATGQRQQRCGTMSEEGNKDGPIAESLEQNIEEVVPDDKKETGGSSAGVMDALRDGLQTVKGAFSTVTGGVGKAWSTLGEWKDGGACVCVCNREHRV